MATPSPQTNEILEQLAGMPGADIPEGLADLLRRRLEGSAQSLAEFEGKALGRGESFREAAQQRIAEVRQSFQEYQHCLEELTRACTAGDRAELARLRSHLESTTQSLFQRLDAYASYYFSWGEQQSPLVNMIRHAVESYSRGPCSRRRPREFYRRCSNICSPPTNQLLRASKQAKVDRSPKVGSDVLRNEFAP